MAIMNTKSEYGSIAKFFHWLIVLLIIINLTLGFSFGVISSEAQDKLVPIHQMIGLSILLLVVLRLLWALINIKPRLPTATARWERAAIWTVHGLLYVVLIAMPLSEWIFSTAQDHPPGIFGLSFPFPGIPLSDAIGDWGFTIHQTLAWVLMILIVIHILAALKHHFYDRDHIFVRMLPGKHGNQR